MKKVEKKLGKVLEYPFMWPRAATGFRTLPARPLFCHHNSTTSVHPPSTAVSLTAFPGCTTDCTGHLCNSLLYKIFPNKESQHPYFSYRLHRAPLQLPHTQPFLNCPIAVPTFFLPAARAAFATASYPSVSELQNRSTHVFPTGCTGYLCNCLIPNRFQIAKSQHPRFFYRLHGPVV